MQTSSDEFAISARGLGKDYRLGELTDVRRFIQKHVVGDRGRRARPDFHALDDISFDVPHGEVVGIVGTNGSGKSTLVQTVAGITVPTSGEMVVRGRVLPLLEVGAGFHYELTGWENVTLFGTILGLTRQEIRNSLDAIAEFGELDAAHMATPVKRFSMGERARLSFAVAMVFPADIYIFDEVMAVVDDKYRATATEEIKTLNARGKTVLFISHDLDQVVTLCQRGIWLDRGRLRMDGPIEDVAQAYSEALAASEDASAASV